MHGEQADKVGDQKNFAAREGGLGENRKGGGWFGKSPPTGDSLSVEISSGYLASLDILMPTMNIIWNNRAVHVHR